VTPGAGTMFPWGRRVKEVGGAQEGCNWRESIVPSDEHLENSNFQLVGGGLICV